MNFREGMRRIGLTVGVMGAIVAALAAFALFFAGLLDNRNVQAGFDAALKLPITQLVANHIAMFKLANADVDLPDNPQGIRSVWANEKGEVSSFTRADGIPVSGTSGPTSLFWFLLYPPIIGVGFVVPCGAVRLVTWIVSGFIRSGARAPQKA
jgi:hypothetical protein